MNTMPPAAEMKRAYLAKDATYDGLFFLGVRTTGIFCRPTCPARKPLPKNVEYFPSAQAAVFAGYRPCKRCRPLESDDQPPWAAELLAEVEREPSPRISDADLQARRHRPSHRAPLFPPRIRHDVPGVHASAAAVGNVGANPR